jgi:hypothetical protein
MARSDVYTVEGVLFLTSIVVPTSVVWFFTEKILDRPPREEDWWVNTSAAKSPPPGGGEAPVTSDDSFDSSAGECDHTAKSRISSGGETCSTSSPHSHKSSTSDNSSSAASAASRRFRNRGLETWVVARDAWRQPASCEDVSHRHDHHHAPPPVMTRSDPPSPAMRKKLVQKVARDRQYTLPRQMPLSEIMSVYQEVWHGDGGEC